MNEGILGGFGGLLTTTPNRLIKETRYTSGTGNHQFREVTNYVKVMLVGGGGSGAVGDGGTSGCTGGSGAETVIYDGPFIFTSRTVLYEVGAGGAARVAYPQDGLAGSRTRLDLLFAMPGRAGIRGAGGSIIMGGSVPVGGGVDIESTSAGNTGINGILRIPGGAAGLSAGGGDPAYAGGKAAGFPFGFDNAIVPNLQYIVNTGSSLSCNASGGGSSLLGLGGSGHNTNGLPGTGYGAGGGGVRSATGTSGAGSGGIIIIMEYLQ